MCNSNVRFICCVSFASCSWVLSCASLFVSAMLERMDPPPRPLPHSHSAVFFPSFSSVVVCSAQDCAMLLELVVASSVLAAEM